MCARPAGTSCTVSALPARTRSPLAPLNGLQQQRQQRQAPAGSAPDPAVSEPALVFPDSQQSGLAGGGRKRKASFCAAPIHQAPRIAAEGDNAGSLLGPEVTPSAEAREPEVKVRRSVRPRGGRDQRGNAAREP